MRAKKADKETGNSKSFNATFLFLNHQLKKAKSHNYDS